jgi:predicted amidohydrolase
MSHWNIAAAQYGGQHQSVDDHITHHLRFIAEAARQRCDLLVFPELSLTGSGRRRYLPPGDAQLEPLLDAAHRYQITVIAGLPVERNGQRQKGSRSLRPLVIASCAIRKVAEPAWCRG